MATNAQEVNRRFRFGIAEFVRRTKQSEEAVVRRVAADLLAAIVYRSPVDTGRFRGNWQVELDKLPDGHVAGTDSSGGGTITRGEEKIAGVRMGQTIFIVNNLPYSVVLEYGHSKQAPGGVVRLTALEYQLHLFKATRSLPV